MLYKFKPVVFKQAMAYNTQELQNARPVVSRMSTHHISEVIYTSRGKAWRRSESGGRRLGSFESFGWWFQRCLLHIGMLEPTETERPANPSGGIEILYIWQPHLMEYCKSLAVTAYPGQPGGMHPR